MSAWFKTKAVTKVQNVTQPVGSSGTDPRRCTVAPCYKIKSLLRRILCLILCVSLLFSAPAPKAEAAVLETALSIGVVACLLLMACGVVFNPKTVEDITAIGQSMTSYLSTWGDENDVREDVDSWIESVVIYNPFGAPDDGDDDDDWVMGKNKISVAKSISAGISLWVSEIMMGLRKVELPSSAVVLSDFYPVCVFLSAGSHNTWYSPLQSPYGVTENFTGSFDGIELRNPSEKSLYSSVVYMVGPLSLSEGTYCIEDNSYTLYYPGNVTAGRYNLSFCVYEVDGDKSTVLTSKEFRFLTSDHESNYTLTNACVFNASSDCSYYLSVAYYGACQLKNDFVGVVFDNPLSLISDEYSSDPAIVGDVQSDLESGAISSEQLPIYDLDITQALAPGTPVLESIQTLGDWLTSNELTLEEYQTMTKGAADPVWEKSIELGSSITYQQNAVADPIEVLASADDKGEILYEWHMYGQDADGNNFSALPIGEGPSIVPSTAEPGTYYYYCKAMNRNLAGYYSHPIFTHSLTVTVTPTSVEPDPGTDSDPGGDPDPGDDPDPGGDSDSSGDIAAGEDFVGQLTDMIPNYSEGFAAALSDFASKFSYEGTEAVLTIPAIVTPEIPGPSGNEPLLKSHLLLAEQQIDFEESSKVIPEIVLLLVQCLLTVALILFCCKELYDVVAYILTLRRGA